MLEYKTVLWRIEDEYSFLPLYIYNQCNNFTSSQMSCICLLSVIDKYHSLSPSLWTEDDPVFTRQDSNRSEKETTQMAHETEPESGSQPRPAVLSGYFKQFQKSLPPRFQRQQVTRKTFYHVQLKRFIVH